MVKSPSSIKRNQINGGHTSDAFLLATTAFFWVTLVLLAEFTFHVLGLPSPFADEQSSFLN